MSNSWAFLRQVVLATVDPSADSAALRATYGLPVGFTDPELLAHGIADETIPVGPRRFVELVSPSGDHSPLTPWLAKRGGRAGYGVAVQVPDIAAIRERVVSRGVGIMIEQEALGHRIMQLHPRQVGILLDLDEVPDRTSWFWDEISPGPAAAALIDDIVEIEIGVPDPCAMATLWSHLLDVEQPTESSVDLDALIQFVAADIASMRAVTMQTATGRTSPADAEFVGVTFRHCPA